MKVLMMTVGKKLNLSRKVMVLTMMMGSPSFLLPWTMKMVIHYRKAKVLLMVTWCHQRTSQEVDGAGAGDLVPSQEVDGAGGVALKFWKNLQWITPML